MVKVNSIAASPTHLYNCQIAGKFEPARMNSKGILIALLMLPVLFGCGPEKTKTIPEELLGTWKTSELKYADTFIELARDTIIFGLAEGPPKVHPVLAVEKSRENGNLLYTIWYQDEERERYKFSFYYDPAGEGTLQWKNQPGIAWTKQQP